MESLNELMAFFLQVSGAYDLTGPYYLLQTDGQWAEEVLCASGGQGSASALPDAFPQYATDTDALVSLPNARLLTLLHLAQLHPSPASSAWHILVWPVMTVCGQAPGVGRGHTGACDFQ